ncbi:B3 domain-containing protein [Hordeum vulgare]|nr:B3 domain-containing protein [Hordeum vulgare]
MFTELTAIVEEGRVAGSEATATIDWNEVELDEPIDLIIAPIPDTHKERAESSFPSNVDEDVDGQLMEEATNDIDHAHDDELVHVYDKENPIIEVGKLCSNMDEFRMCFKTYAVKHEFDSKIIWTDRNKFYATCRGFDGSVKPCKWYISPRLQPDGITTEENPAPVKFHTEETHVEVHAEETKTDVNIQTEKTVVEVETEKIESLVCVDEVLKPVKKTKTISELVCVVEPKTRFAKAKKGTWREMEFFTVILEKSSRLVLPHNFVKMLDGHRPQNMKLRQAGNGLHKLWDVEVVFDADGRMYLDRGWKQFVRAYDLGIGYFLVFRYDGNATFAVKVFDTTMCRRRYQDDDDAEEYIPQPGLGLRRSKRIKMMKEKVKKEE